MSNTEIQLADRSTVLVPNSEFITKAVRNVTHGNPVGLVQIKLPMPLATDVELVRSTLLAAFAVHADLLAEPAPPHVRCACGKHQTSDLMLQEMQLIGR